MIDRTARLATLLMLASALGGCAIFGHSKQYRAAHVQQAEDPAVYAAQQAAAGRAALDRHDYAMAIGSFRNVLRFPEYAGLAHNGMAVAYDGIGRADLAERHFLAAIEAAPEDGRYRNNLVRLYARQDNMMPAMLADAIESVLGKRLAAQAETPAERTEVAEGVYVERPLSRLRRAANGEVMLSAAPPRQLAETKSAPGVRVVLNNADNRVVVSTPARAAASDSAVHFETRR